MDKLTPEEQQRAINIAYDIQDNLHAIKMELQKPSSYKYYLKEKIDKINTDMRCLTSMVEEEEH